VRYYSTELAPDMEEEEEVGVVGWLRQSFITDSRHLHYNAL